MEREDEDKRGESRYVSDQKVTGRLRPLKDLRLIFLAACESARRDTASQEPNPYVGLAPKLVQAGVPAVVAMQDEVEIDAARQLTAQFYSQLLDHGYVDLALNMARYTLYSADDKQWTIPVLYMRLAGGRLFAPQAAGPPDESADATQPGTTYESIGHQLLIELRDILAQRFNSTELRDLVFYMDIDYEDLSGQTKAAKARELVTYCQRRGLIPKLIEVGQRQRPEIPWPSLS
jgi:CHAT domain-containing protein